MDTSDYFRRENYDVHTTAFISLSQALLGGVIRITGLHQDINLRIPQVHTVGYFDQSPSKFNVIFGVFNIHLNLHTAANLIHEFWAFFVN